MSSRQQYLTETCYCSQESIVYREAARNRLIVVDSDCVENARGNKLSLKKVNASSRQQYLTETCYCSQESIVFRAAARNRLITVDSTGCLENVRGNKL